MIIKGGRILLTTRATRRPHIKTHPSLNKSRLDLETYFETMLGAKIRIFKHALCIVGDMIQMCNRLLVVRPEIPSGLKCAELPAPGFCRAELDLNTSTANNEPGAAIVAKS